VLSEKERYRRKMNEYLDRQIVGWLDGQMDRRIER
jgi:hypothetical protein